MMTGAFILLGACSFTQEPAPYTAYGVSKGAGSAGIHTVLEGDTVYTISKNYNLPMREIITVNSLSAPYKLTTGYRMRLPPPNEHRVRDGDTLYGVARTYDVSVNRLVQMNNITAPYKLIPGDTLRLPTPARIAEGVEQRDFGNSSKQGSFQTVSTARVQGVERAPLDAPSRKVEKVVLTPDVQPKKDIPKKITGSTPELSTKGGKFMRPVSGKVISKFGPKAGGLHNDGVNIKAVRGTPVRAAENGVVVYSGNDLPGYGNLVLVRHEGKLVSAYAHLHKSLVKRGDKVKRGQSLGTVGSTGQVDSPQLHFEIRKGAKVLNPEKYI